MAVNKCVSQTPFGSLLAAVITCVGVGLFCGTGYQALTIIIRGICEELFGFHVIWLNSMQTGFIVFGVVMGLLSIFLLVFAFLAISSTRQNIYSGIKCIMGGRTAAMFFVGLTTILDCVWIGITSFCALAIIIFLMVQSICITEVYNQQNQYIDHDWGFCLNLSRFVIYRNYTEGADQNALCDEEELNSFCTYVEEAGRLLSLTFAGAFLITLGMVVFSASLGSYYARLQVSKEISNYRGAYAMNDVSREGFR